MIQITSLAQLDEKLDLATEAAKQSSDKFREILDSFVLDHRRLVGRLPEDARSDDYRNAQLEFYKLLTGSDYQTDNEKTPFDHKHMMRWPFPYSTRSNALVGDYLMTYGNLIKTMNLAQGARILEIGSGYGPLTYHLASMGHHVTCVDIHEPLLEYIRERTRDLPGKVETVLADMNDLSLKDSFDAIIFFESFHHAADHVGLLERLPELLDPHGVLVLAGEPIVPKGSQAVPYPWGLRLDGLSLWFIRRLGWLELGFEEGYLKGLLEAMGWEVACKPAGLVSTMSIWLARRSAADSVYQKPYLGGQVNSWSATNTRLQTQVGNVFAKSGSLRSDGRPGYLTYGPYIPLETGFYEVHWVGSVDEPGATGQVDVSCNGGETIFRAAKFNLPGQDRGHEPEFLLHMRFSINSPVQDLEFRMLLDSGTKLTIDKIVLRKF